MSSTSTAKRSVQIESAICHSGLTQMMMPATYALSTRDALTAPDERERERERDAAGDDDGERLDDVAEHVQVGGVEIERAALGPAALSFSRREETKVFSSSSVVLFYCWSSRRLTRFGCSCPPSSLATAE